MLVLTRKVGESIRINDDISVFLLEMRGAQVRLGVNAPKDIVVHREEVYKKIKQKKRKGAGSKD